MAYCLAAARAAADGAAALAAADGAAALAAADGAAALAAADGAATAAAGVGVARPEQAPTMTAIAASAATLRVRLVRFMRLDSSILRPDALIWSAGRAVSLRRSRVIAGLPTSLLFGRTGEPPRMLLVRNFHDGDRADDGPGSNGTLGAADGHHPN